MKNILFFLFILFVTKDLYSANFYWRATASDNLFTNVGNWETAPGNLITPGVAPTSGDSVFFPVTSNFASINMNGGVCGVLTLTSPTIFTFTGTGNFYGDINANGNIRFSGNVNLRGNTVKNINLDPNPNTITVFFSSGNLNFIEGTVNLQHNIYHNGTINVYHSATTTVLNGNGNDIVATNLIFGNNSDSNPAGMTVNLSNSYLELNYLRIRNVFTKDFSNSRIKIKGTLTFSGHSSSTAIVCQYLEFTNSSSISMGGVYTQSGFNVDTLVFNTPRINTTISGVNLRTDVLNILTPCFVSNSSNTTFAFNTINTPSPCLGHSVFFGPSNINTLSPVTNTSIDFSGMNFVGSGYTTSSSNDLGNNIGAAITWGAPVVGQVFHWVGDAGDWEDPTKWSLLGSGGSPQLPGGCIPTAIDSVVFDNNSFTSVGQVVNTVNTSAICKSINVIDTDNEGSFNGTLNFTGHANFTGANSVNNVVVLGATASTVNSGPSLIYSGNFVTRSSGSCNLVSDLRTVGNLIHYTGGFNSNGYTITANLWRSRILNINFASRSVNIDNSVLNLSAGMSFTSSKLDSLSALNSTIYINNNNGQAEFRNDGVPRLVNPTFNDLVFVSTNGTASLYSAHCHSTYYFNNIYFNSSSVNTNINGPYVVDTLHLSSGKNYIFTSGVTYNINHIDVQPNACDEFAVVETSSPGSQANFRKVSPPFTTNNLMIKDINASGTTLNVTGGVDNGNLTNITFTPATGRDLYWVGDAGSWNDGGHWSIGVSGGNPSVTNPNGCIPRPIDNVFFDINSFSLSGQTVSLNIDGNCKDMTWTTDATSYSPIFSGGFSLYVYGSLELNNGMIHNHTGATYMRGGDTTAYSQTINTDSVLFRSRLRPSGGGRYDFINRHIQAGSVAGIFPVGQFGKIYTNGNYIKTSKISITLSAANSFFMDSSLIDIYGGGSGNSIYLAGITKTNFSALNSVVHLLNPGSFEQAYFTSTSAIDTIVLNDIIIGNTTTLFATNNFQFNKVEFRGMGSTISGGSGNLLIDTLIYRQSSTNNLDPNKSLIVLDTLIADGTPCVPITLKSSISSVPAIIRSGSCNFDVQFGNIQDLTADLGSGCTSVGYRVFGNDAGGNANWNFVTPPSTNQLGNDTTVYCTEAPYTINTDGFGSAPATYLWNTGETTKTIEVDTGGIYSVYVTYTAGCIAFDTVVVTILDTVAPVLTCPLDSTVYLNGICQYVLGDFTDSVAVDDCTPDSALILTQLPVPGTVYSGESIQTIWIYAEDNYGNIDSCSFQLTLLDTLNPLVTCKDTTVYLNALGTYSIDTSYVFVNANDNCGVDSIWITPTNYTCADTGLNTVTVYARDNNNNVDSCIANVTVLDTLNPLVTCKDTNVYLNALGTYSIDTSYVFVNASDNCGVDSIWITTNTFNCTKTGVNTVTVYVRDNNGNVDSCASNITVQDTLNPVVTCKDTTIYLTALGTYTIDTSYVFVNASDNCGVDSIWITTNTFNCADTGINTVTVYARDNSSNVDSCIANVTVLDTINPITLCKDTVVYLDGTGSYVIDSSYINNGSYDACGIQTITLSKTIFTCLDTGLNTVTLYVRDNNNNLDSCTANVTVLDTLNPVVTCKDTTVYLNALGTYTIDTSYVFVNASDNCGVDSIWITTNTFNCTNTGVNTVTVYARDNNNNVDSCIANVTVLDTLNPLVTCQDTTIYLNASGTYTIDTSYVFANASDNCEIDSIWITTNTFNCADTGVNTVTVYARDNSNNVDSCIANVTVLDTINPIITCQDTTIYLNTSGTYTIDTSYVFANASDNCGIDSIWITTNTFNCADTGVNTITLYVRDNNNNLDSCTANVTVLDTIPPIVICNDTTIYLGINGQYTIDTSYIFTSASDNCSVDSIWTNDTLYTCANIGTTQATIYTRDASGNIDSCVANVTVMDTLTPTVICQDTTIYLSPAGTYTIDTSYVLASVMDNCTLDSVWLTPANFTCADTGLNMVTIYARDVNNNIDSCLANVTVLDTVNPTINCQNATIYLDTNGQFIIDTSYVYSSAFAGCGLDSIWIVDSVFDCSRIGVNAVSVYARDINGNVDSCQAQVTVMDTVTPQITCGSTLYDTVSNSCEYIVPDFRVSTLPIDNCTDSINFQIIQVPAPGTVITVQDQQIETITLTVTDTNGNPTVCMFDVELTCSDEFQIPEFISPNGDGKNDTWIITGIEAYPNNNVKIFNRYGAMVYQTNGYHNQWDGTANVDYIFQAGESNQILPSGTYFYRLELDVNDNKSEVYTGMVQLTR